MTIQQFKTQCFSSLKNSPSASLDIDVLLMHALDMQKTTLLLNRDFEIPEEKMRWLLEAVSKRQKGLPVAYITGHKEFYGYDFEVTPDVLIPKPDTEILVERAIDLLTEKIVSNDADGRAEKEEAIEVCDMCTGSGCVGLSVLRSLIDDPSISPTLIPEFTLCDISEAALCIAKKNAATLIPDEFLHKVRFCLSDLFFDVPQKFSAILSNPPYIPHKIAVDLLSDGRNEPLQALDGDVLEHTDDFPQEALLSGDGLAIPKRLLLQAASQIHPKGFVLMECGEYNIQDAADFAAQNAFSVENIHRDLEGQMRVLELVKKR